MIRWLPYFLLLPLAALGSYASMKTQENPILSLILIVFSGIVGGLLWYAMCRIHVLPYAISSALYSLIYELGYLIFFLTFSKEALSIKQVIGIALATLGAILIGT